MDIRARSLSGDENMTWEEALERMAAAAKNQGKAWGAMPRNADHVRNLHQLGAQFIPYGIDLALLITGLKQSAADLDDIYGA